MAGVKAFSVVTEAFSLEVLSSGVVRWWPRPRQLVLQAPPPQPVAPPFEALPADFVTEFACCSCLMKMRDGVKAVREGLLLLLRSLKHPSVTFKKVE